MAEIAKALGIGHKIEHKGESYTLRALTLEDLAAFEVWLEDQALRRIERHRGRIDAETYAARLDAVARMVAAGEFQYSGPTAMAAMRQESGIRFLWWRMLGANPGMTEELANEIFDADRAASNSRMTLANADHDADPLQAPADAS